MANVVIVCLGYVAGLLLTDWSKSLVGIPLGIWILASWMIVCVGVIPRWWRTGPRRTTWAIAGLVGLIAFGYLQWRSPSPGDQDISGWVTRNQPVEVRGEIVNEPRLTRNQSVRFWLTVEDCRVDEPGEPPENATGKLYVTIPLLQGTGLEPHQRVAIAGELYRPRPADSPGEFDFQKYLARQGSFAGLRGETVIQHDRAESATGWGGRQLQAGLRSLRQRVIQAQVDGLGSGGLLVSSMVLGRRAVDLPYDIYDRFVQAGMAHTLAASGFHVTLLLGLTLGLTAGRDERQQGAIALGVLLLYVGLTGLHPSVARAGFMGAAAVLGLVMQRRVNALRSLLVAAVILLIFNPLWIWDLGFQFSFLATFGLLVTAPPLTQRLDWMPPNLASLVAIPLAAFIWTVPIQLFSFGVMPLYSIGANVLLTPLVWFISIGGMVTGTIALISPTVGSYAAAVLYVPVELLLRGVAKVTQLPGHSYAVGTVAIAQVLLVYAVLVAIWQIPRWRSRWWVGGLVAIALILAPAVYRQTTQIQLVALPTREPVLVWQHRGEVGLVNAGTDTDVQYTVLPFLRQQGINHIDWAIALTSPSPSDRGWYRLLAAMPIGQFYGTETALPLIEARSPLSQSIPVSKALQIGQAQITLQLLPNAHLTTVQFLDQTWLLLEAEDDLLPDANLPELPTADVVWWSDRPPSLSFLDATQPKALLSTHDELPTPIQDWLTQQGRSLYSLSDNGAVVWQRSGLRVTQSQDTE